MRDFMRELILPGFAMGAVTVLLIWAAIALST